MSHEEIVKEILSQKIHRPFFVSERIMHDPKKRSFYVRKKTKLYDELLISISNSVEKNPCVILTIENGPYTMQILEILKENEIEVQLIELGTPFTKIKEREMIKIWSGWDVFPQIFLNGFLLGGYDELKISLEDGTFEKILKIKRKISSPRKFIQKKQSMEKIPTEKVELSDTQWDNEYYQKCIDLSEITLEELQVPEKFRLDESEFKQPYSEIVSLLKKLNIVHTPEEQLAVLEKSIGDITLCIEYHYKKNLKNEEVMVGADDLIPIFIYCIIKAKVKRLYTMFKKLTEFCDFKGGGGYSIATLDTTLNIISNLKTSEEILKWNWDNAKLNDF